MKKIIFCLIISLVPQLVSANTFTKTQIQGIDFRYVTYGVNSDLYRLKVMVSDDATNLEDLAIKHNAVTAINWIFFCPSDYPQCWWKSYTINERFVNGEDLSYYSDTWDRGIFAWNREGSPFIHQTNAINNEKRWEIYEWLWNFPILYADGINMLEGYHDSWLYDSKMKATLDRHFICSNKNKTEIIFGRSWPTSLDDLAPALYELGCWDALNLDAWNSAQYIYNGRKLVSGPRKILDGFAIERVWLDIQKIETDLDTLFPLLVQDYRKFSAKKESEKLKELLAVISAQRVRIYDRNSHNIYSDTWEQIWYQINTIEIAEIRKIYVYNGLERRIKKLIVELSEEF